MMGLLRILPTEIPLKTARAVSRNPSEVFLIEGYTTDYNLSLSVRRAETTAKLLIQQFHVPAENLATQGYTSQVRTSPVIIRRITPLLTGQN
jgi:OOP family OmpA-OmpF porin